MAMCAIFHMSLADGNLAATCAGILPCLARINAATPVPDCAGAFGDRVMSCIASAACRSGPSIGLAGSTGALPEPSGARQVR